MLKFLKTLSLDTRGVSALEYAVLAAVLLAAVAVGVGALTGEIGPLFARATAVLSGAGTP